MWKAFEYVEKPLSNKKIFKKASALRQSQRTRDFINDLHTLHIIWYNPVSGREVSGSSLVRFPLIACKCGDLWEWTGLAGHWI